MSRPSVADRSPRVHRGEWSALVVSFGYFFCVLSAYYVVRPVREQLAAAVGSVNLPRFYAATLVAMLLLTPVFAGLVARWPRRVVVPLVNLFFIVGMLAFVPLFAEGGALDARTLGTVFFVWVSVFNLFVVAVFWSFMADIWSAEQAQRLFPLIALGGTAGAVAGPSLTRGLVDVIGVAPLLAVSATLLGLAVGCVVWLGRWARKHGARRHEAGHEAAVGGGMFDGLKQIFADPVMRGMAILLLLSDGIGTVAYALVADYSGATFADEVARTRFAAEVDLATNTLQVLLQLGITRWLLARYGAAPALAGWALGAMAVLLLAALVRDPYAPLVGAMPAVAVALIVSRALAYGMANPARESLFARVPRSQRYKGKNAVDTAVWRFGDLSIALGMNALRTAGMGVAGFAALGALSAAAGGVLGWRLARRVERSGGEGAPAHAHV
ncbi:NTP/NDP exchange transporter [Vulcaniibacterium gelatinicum]|uniref:NTP/NDP exchange transporter n=1 Tax=Vulcaniibacterium gelatinicum TaxID=2598725 RepID=UPI0011CC3F2C|nr:MFS transporter [Vulcaniibacterium gelatinicum]